MSVLSQLIETELRRRCLKWDDVEVVPVLFTVGPALKVTTEPGGIFYVLEKCYGTEMNVTRLKGTYALRSARTPLSLSFANVQSLPPTAAVLAQAVSWSYDSPSLHEGTLEIEVSRMAGGVEFSFNIQMIAINKREGGCETC
jgi:hypothetical protein